jgi:acetyltransferase-like isoleucine patch superfamily enzyme
MRERLKQLASTLAAIVVIPRVIAFRVSSAILGADRALQGATQSLARIAGVRGQYLRRAFLSRSIARCHRTATICYGTVFSAPGAMIDEYVYVGARCHLGLVHLERDVLLGDAVHIPSGRHIHGSEDPDIPIREQPGRPELVRIGAGTWIGSGSIILANVGRNSIIGAGSVVTRPIPEDVLAGGTPARVIRSRRAAALPGAAHTTGVASKI